MPDVVTCPDKYELQKFLLGQLPEDEVDRLQQHFTQCHACLNTVRWLATDDALVVAVRSQATAVPGGEDDVVEELIARLSAKPSPSAAGLIETLSNASPVTSDPSIATAAESYAFLAPPQEPDELGRLGAYRVLRLIGAGGMGLVFEAEDPQLKRRVALKAMRPGRPADVSGRMRFLREAQATAAIEHDHIVTIHQVGEDRDVPFFAMQLLRGETLEDRLQRLERGRPPQRLAVSEILRIACEVAEGLAAAHARGLTHRDVKPANIWLESGDLGHEAMGRNQGTVSEPGTSATGVQPSGRAASFNDRSFRVKLLDFGLARPAVDDAHLTQTGVIAGTPQYMAPEQAAGEVVDHRCDLFALGCVLYRICTNRLPFTGSNTMAVLRALAVEQPRPPREHNPAVPPALADLTMQLLSKDPSQRPQTAAVVVHSLLTIERVEAERAKRQPERRRLAPFVATAAMLATGIAAVLYMGPAAVYRFAANQGQLVIETDDSDVEVTVKQNGELVEVVDRKTGHQVTLKAGAYELEITKGKDGLALNTHQFKLTRGGAKIVEVQFEPAAVAKTVQPPESGAPFVILAHDRQSESKHADLVDAVNAAQGGAVIEIRGNGPFVTPAIRNDNRALVLRAGAGFWPVLQIDAKSLNANRPLISTGGPLVLEGLHFWHVEDKPASAGAYSLIFCGEAPLSVTHCRFFIKGNRNLTALGTLKSPRVQVRHCEFAGGGMTVAINCGDFASFHQVEVADCLCWGAPHFVNLQHYSSFVPREIAVRLHRNTFVGHEAVTHYYAQLPAPPANPDLRPLLIEARENIFDAGMVFGLIVNEPGKFQPDVDQPLLPRCLAWNESKNLYTGGLLRVGQHRGKYLDVIKSQKDWQIYWGLKDTDCLPGRLRYQGGDVRAMKAAGPDRLTAADFRLHRSSDGKGDGENGRDLGADVDKLGPGKAYEEWKKSPAYPKWLAVSGQVCDPEPFVVMTIGKKREFTFANLREAIDFANSGDGIEIRGNGPFVTEPVKIVDKGLTFRSGRGFAPVIQLSAAGIKAGATLLETNASLTVEGLEFQRVGTDELPAQLSRMLLFCQRAPLHLANCRFLLKGSGPSIAVQGVESPRLVVRNCMVAGAPEVSGFMWVRPPRGQMTVENCVIAAPNSALIVRQIGFDSGGSSVRIDRNTILAGAPFNIVFHETAVARNPAVRPTQVDATDNLFNAQYIAFFHQHSKERQPLEIKTGQARLRELLAWRDQRNLYWRNDGYLWIQSDPLPLQTVKGPKSLADWHALWEAKETGSLEGRPRYQSARLNALDFSRPEDLRAEDFRLQSGSPGQGAGEAGRDLGATVELVGPGPAYDYWKKTPEYQLWLKKTAAPK